MVTVYTYFYKQKSRLLMEAAGPLFYSFSDFEHQEYPTINAIRVRNSKRKAKEKALTCTDTAQNEGSGAC